MRLIKQSLLIVCLVFLFQFQTFAQEWSGRIIPMQTTIDEVGEMIKEKPEKKEDSYLFQLKEGNLSIYFSPGNCLSGAYGGWTVAKGTVTHITFHPKKRRKLSYYKVNIENMERGYDSGHRLYIDNERGVMYSTQFNKVSSITYYPGTRYENLRCKKE